MEELIKKVAYIKGLAEGADLSKKTPEGKILNKVLEVLEELTDYVADMDDELSLTDERVTECEDYLDIIADDFYDDDGTPIGDEDDDDFDIFGDDDEDDDDLFDFNNEADDEDNSDFFEIECPGCGEDVLVDFDQIDDDNGIICPNCHREIVLEFDTDADSDTDAEDGEE